MGRRCVNWGWVGCLARPLLPIPRPDVKPWWLSSLTHFTLPTCPGFTQHTHIHAQAHVDTVLSPSSRQEHGIVSHVGASSCAAGAMWGARSAKQWVGGGAGWSVVEGVGCHGGGGWRGRGRALLPWSVSFFCVCVFFFGLPPLLWLRMKEAICPPAAQPKLPERP